MERLLERSSHHKRGTMSGTRNAANPRQSSRSSGTFQWNATRTPCRNVPPPPRRWNDGTGRNDPVKKGGSRGVVDGVPGA